MPGRRPTRRIAIDPGKTTGLVLFTGPDLTIGMEAASLLEVRRFILDGNPDEVIIERYFAGKGITNAEDPLKVIGAAQVTCDELGIPVEYQSSSILTEKMWSLAKGVSPSRHVRAAAAHVIYRLRKLKQWPY